MYYFFTSKITLQYFICILTLGCKCLPHFIVGGYMILLVSVAAVMRSVQVARVRAIVCEFRPLYVLSNSKYVYHTQKGAYTHSNFIE